MQRMLVRDLMVPLEEYATVSEDVTLFEAVMALEEAQLKHDEVHYKHRAILVFDKDKNIVGKLSQLDVLRALEPEYDRILDNQQTSRLGFSPAFIKSMLDKFQLWQRPLEDICRKAFHIKVKDIMYTPTRGEYVEESVSLNQAIHQLIVGHHQSLLVAKGQQIVGVLRLTDVFHEVINRMKICSLNDKDGSR